MVGEKILSLPPVSCHLSPASCLVTRDSCHLPSSSFPAEAAAGRFVQPADGQRDAQRQNVYETEQST